jgi:hypothetical protein
VCYIAIHQSFSQTIYSLAHYVSFFLFRVQNCTVIRDSFFLFKFTQSSTRSSIHSVHVIVYSLHSVHSFQRSHAP